MAAGDDASRPVPLVVRPLDDPERIEATERLVPARHNEALDRLAELAARLVSASSAQVSLLAGEQVVAGASGMASPAGTRSPVEESLCTATARNQGDPLVVDEARADERVAMLPPVTQGIVGSYLGVPLAGQDGMLVGSLCVFDQIPRSWSDEDVAVLNRLAEAVSAELELMVLTEENSANQVRWELAAEAGGIGTYEYDLVEQRLMWDDRLKAMFGYGDEFGGTMEEFNRRLHPDDRARVDQAIQESVDNCGDYLAEYRVILPSGVTRWIRAKGRTLCGEDGLPQRLIGAAYDTTVIHEIEARIARALESTSVGFYSVDAEFRFTYVNAEAERLLGASRHDLLGKCVYDEFPAVRNSVFEQSLNEALTTQKPTSFEVFYPVPLDAWYEVRAWPDADGLSVYFLDITARKRAEQQASRNAERAILLAELGSQLGETLESEEMLDRVSRLIVPALAEWCVVTAVDNESGPSTINELRAVGAYHSDPALVPTVQKYASSVLTSMRDPALVNDALRTGEPLIIPSGVMSVAAEVLFTGEARETLAALNPDQLVMAPLQARGRVLGFLTLFGSIGSSVATPDNIELATEVASRVALALDNARLHDQYRRLSEDLQRALLTDPPQPDHLEIVVRYVPAAEVAQVGGDWYDSFMQPNGSTALVIGDVVGHDTQAAAAMGQIRGLLRGIAATTGEGPAAVLTRLDQAMSTLNVATTATAVVARLEQTPEEKAEQVTRIRWSNAGHPPPFVIDADGRVSALDEFGPDLLLGVEMNTERHEYVATVQRGSTLFMYTDGLIERRDQSVDEGLARLSEVLDELKHKDLEVLCDEVLARLMPEVREDDVAVAAVRLHPEF